MGQGLAIEEKAGAFLQSLLLPQKAPDWYSQREGGAATQSFPPAPPGSFKLLGHVSLAAPSLEDEVAQFYVGCLGARACRRHENDGSVELCLGPSKLILRARRSEEGAADEGDSTPWQGHFYIWVEDLDQTWRACQALEQSSGQRIIHEAHRAPDASGAEVVTALALASPSGAARFVVNKAPGSFVQPLRRLGAQGGVQRGGAQEGPPPACLALLQVTCEVPRGTAAGIARFYRHFLQAPVVEEDGQCSVYFSPGEALTQTLTYVEPDEEEEQEAGQGEAPSAEGSAICIYMPSPSRFSAALEACLKANIATCSGESVGDLQGTAERAGEFRIQGCVDPESGDDLFKLEHTIRLPDHPECSVASSPQSSPPEEETTIDPHRVIALAEVAQHKDRSDAWIALNGRVYDVTAWISRHPGGVHAIMNRIGTDASDEWNMIHKPGTVERFISRPHGPKLMGLLEAEA